MPSEINASLTQQGPLGQVREYQIHKGAQLKIAIGGKVRQQVYQVHLLALGDKSKIKLHIARLWFWCMLVSWCALTVYLLLKKFLALPTGIYDFSIVAVLSTGGVLGAVMVLLKLNRCRVFYSRAAHVPLFDILVNRPDRRSYTQFIDALHSHAKKTREGRTLRPDQQTAGEIRMLRRLAGEGVISLADYERAKAKLLGQQ